MVSGEMPSGEGFVRNLLFTDSTASSVSTEGYIFSISQKAISAVSGRGAWFSLMFMTPLRAISSLLVVKSPGCVIITRFDTVLASVSIQPLSDFLRLTVRMTLVTSSGS